MSDLVQIWYIGVSWDSELDCVSFVAEVTMRGAMEAVHISVKSDVGNMKITFGCRLGFVLDTGENRNSLSLLVTERHLAENC